MRTLAIITARKNSKGIPGKNMIDLGGMPLLEHTLSLADKTLAFDKVFLSTDIPEGLELVKLKYPKIDAPFLRPDELCTDSASHIDVVKHVLDYKEKTGENYSHFVLLQPTTPFRTTEEMNRGVAMLKAGAESVLGVSPVMHHPADYLTVDSSGKLHYLLPELKNKRRQEFMDVFFDNGAFYGCRTSFFLENLEFHNENSELLIMGEEALIDIDTPFDLKLAGALTGKQ